MNWREHITLDNRVLLGKPTIKGTRISIEHILDLLASGWSEKDLLENYPRLTPNSIRAVFAYIQEMMKDGFLFSEAAESGK
ncbi:Uncharacterized conserved protein, DUF433 family [Algoriphagus ornithinivorans]|uniref:Uncharacterized conserved protein, DUF433 family n=1 Tax=Algoriphagus ornithinivorans TaxID=226506 RepID=A0A1I5FWJ3_9BACT|nr:DUF433 domain-containing protein [Algoriphagus ornithinivorans]SFO28105.1 Uncharacterized conserved protein, DUF433 family [Algoriphagus ornithinivorans]